MWANVFDKLQTYAHIPVAIVVFIVTTIIHVKTHADLGPNYVNSLYAMYGFLAAHGGTQMWGRVKGNDSNDSSAVADSTK